MYKHAAKNPTHFDWRKFVVNKDAYQLCDSEKLKFFRREQEKLKDELEAINKRRAQLGQDLFQLQNLVSSLAPKNESLITDRLARCFYKVCEENLPNPIFTMMKQKAIKFLSEARGIRVELNK